MTLMKLSTYMQAIFAVMACVSTISVMGYSAEKELLSKMINVIDQHSNNDGKVLPDEMHAVYDTKYEDYIKSKMQQSKDPKYDTNSDGQLDEAEIVFMQYELVKEFYSRGVMDCLLIFRFDEDKNQDLDYKEYAKLLADTSSVQEAMQEAKECHVSEILFQMFDSADTMSMDKWMEQIENAKEADRWVGKQVENLDGEMEDERPEEPDATPGLCDVFMDAIGAESHYKKDVKYSPEVRAFVFGFISTCARHTGDTCTCHHLTS